MLEYLYDMCGVCGGRKMRMLELRPNKTQDDDRQSLEVCLNKMLLYFSLAGLGIQMTFKIL